MRNAAALCLGLLAATIAGPVAGDESPPRIREIHFVRTNVFSEAETAESGMNRWANDFHVVTRESVIRIELLFREGEALDEQLLRETERKIRQLDFINFVEIVAEPVDDGFVDITVTTQDAWSLVPGFVLEGGGDLTEFGFQVSEVNLLGHGKLLWLQAIDESDVGTTWSGGLDYPQLFGTQWIASGGAANGPLLETVSVDVTRPFYSSDTKWSGGGNFTRSDETVRLFNDGAEVSRLREESESATLSVARAFGPRYKKKTVEIELRYEDRQFSSLGTATTTPLPNNQLIYATTASLFVENARFATDTRIDKFTRVEDFTLGRESRVSVGRAGFPVQEGLQRWEGRLSHEQAFKFDKQYLFLEASYTTEETQNKIGRFDTRYYRKFRHQTFAVNLELDLAEDLETSRQFVLGGNSGLRGYPAREFTGDKRLLLNVETRIFTPLSLLGVDVGSVVFVDSGEAWKRNESVNLSDLNYSAGMGLRLGFTNLPDEPIARLDVGWALNDSGFAVTFGVEQHF